MSREIKTLVIGWRGGNVADTWIKMHGEGPRATHLCHYPTPEEMDMLRPETFDDYLAKHGPFDQILYCAGRNRLEWIQNLNPQDLVDAYQINALALVNLVTAHMRMFREFPLKRVVAIVSDSSRTPMRGSLAYSSSKAALVGVLKNMARELAPHTVVVGVSPGIIEDTPMTDYIDDTVPVFRGWDPEKARSYENTMIPMQRRATKREVAETIQFALTGPEYLSGSIIEITGGK